MTRWRERRQDRGVVFDPRFLPGQDPGPPIRVDLPGYVRATHLLRILTSPAFVVFLSLTWLVLTPVDCDGKPSGPPEPRSGWDAGAPAALVPLGVLVVSQIVALCLRRPRPLRALAMAVGLILWGLPLGAIGVGAFIEEDSLPRWRVVVGAFLLAQLPVVSLASFVREIRRRARPLEVDGLEVLRAGSHLVALAGAAALLPYHQLGWEVYPWLALTALLFLVEAVLTFVLHSALGVRILLAWQGLLLETWSALLFALTVEFAIGHRIESYREGWWLSFALLFLWAVASLHDLVRLGRDLVVQGET